MAVDNLIDINKPLGLDAKFAAIPNNISLPTDGIAALTKEVPPVDLNNLVSEDVMKNIYDSSMNYVKNSKPDPRISKFADKSLTDRYEGLNVTYSDLGLDPSKVDAKYSKTQSITATSLNNLKVGSANLGAMFTASVLGIPDIINSIVSGKNITESPIMNTLFDFRDEVAKNNPTFQNEQDSKTDAWSTIKNIVLPTYFTGATSGWGTVFENVAFGIGAGLGLAAEEVAISFVAPGVGNSAALAKWVATSLNGIDKIRKTLTLADRIYDTSKAFTNIRTALDVSNKITNGAKWGYRMGIGAHGEAAFEGLETIHQLGNTLKQEYYNTHGYNPTGKDLENINKIVNETGQTRYLANLALLSVSNGIGLQRLFKNFDLAKDTAEQLGKQGLKISLNSEGKAIVKSNLSDWWNKGFQSKFKSVASGVKSGVTSDLFKESFSEGGEEFLQLGIDESTNSYAKWRMNHGGQESLNEGIKAIQEGLGNSFNTKGLGAFISGAISGVAQQAAFSIPNINKQFKIKEEKQKQLQETLNTYDTNIPNLINIVSNAFNINSVRGSATSKALNANAIGVANKVLDYALDNGNVKLYKDAEAVNLFSLISPYAERGHGNILKEQFNFSLEQLSDVDTQEMFGMSKSEVGNKFNLEVDKANQSFSNIKQAFKNPYRPTDINYSLFEDHFIPELAFLDYRIKDLKSRRLKVQTDIGDYYDEFKYFADLKNIPLGRKYIEQQIALTKEDVAFKSSLPDKDLDDKNEIKEDNNLRKAYEESLALLDEFTKNESEEIYDEFLNSYHEAIAMKLEKPRGFLRKDEVMQKISDGERITGNLISAEKMLNSYLGKNGEQLFIQGFEALARKEQRLRDAKDALDETREYREALYNSHPDLTEDEINELVRNVSSVEDVLKKAEEFKERKAEKDKARQIIAEKIRDEFIKYNLGDMVDDYLSSNPDVTFKDAKKFIKDFNDENNKKIISNISAEFLQSIKDLGDFKNDNILNIHSEDKTKLDALNDEGKVKYTQEIIKSLNQIKKQIPVYLDIVDKTIEYYKNLKWNTENIPTPPIEDKEEIEESLNEGENNLENKFENGYYNPEWYDKNGIPTLQEDLEEYELLNTEFENKSEQEISDMIKANLVIKTYDEKNLNQPAKIKDSKGKWIGQLTQEPILFSRTTDSIVLNYQLGDKLIPLQTYKHPYKGLGFIYEEEFDRLLSGVKEKNEIIAEIKKANFNYYEFIKNATINPKAFNSLQKNGLINFKGTPQEQLNKLNDLKKKFDFIKDNQLENYDLKRIFYGIRTYDQSKKSLTSIKYPFANISGINYRTIVRVVERYKIGEELKLEIVGMPDELHSEVKKLVKTSLDNLYKNEAKGSPKGYFTLITDSLGKPSIYLLTNKTVSNDKFVSEFNNNIEDGKVLRNVAIIDPSHRYEYNIKKKEGKLAIIVTDTFNNNFNSIDYYNLNNKSVNGLLAHLKSQMSDSTKWFNKESNSVSTELYNTDKLSISFVMSTSEKPSTVQEIIDTRDIASINPTNFLVNKISLSEKIETGIKIEVPIIEKQEEDITWIDDIFGPDIEEFGENNINNLAVKLGISTHPSKFPVNISLDEIAKLTDKISNLLNIPKEDVGRIILFATSVTDKNNYLNDSPVTDSSWSKLLNMNNAKLVNTLSKKDVLNLFTKQSSPKTRVTVEDKIQEIIKQCL